MAIFSVVIALSYEVKSGRLSQSDLSGLQGNRLLKSMRASKGEPPSKIDIIQEKYPEVKFEQTVISPIVLGDLLFRGWVDKVALTNELDASSYFADPSSELAWKTALGVWRLDDETIEKACKVLECEFLSREFIEPNQMFMIFGERLFLSEVGLLTKSKAEIRSECIEYIDDLRKSGKIRNKYKEETLFGDFGGWGGYAFPCGETDDFAKIVAHYKNVVDGVTEEAMPSTADELLKMMSEEPVKFGRMIFRNTYERSPYTDVPVLRYISVQGFAEVLVGLQPEEQTSIIGALKYRYEANVVDDKVKDEMPWLEKVFEFLVSKSEELRPASRFRICSGLRRYILPILEHCRSTSSTPVPD